MSPNQRPPGCGNETQSDLKQPTTVLALVHTMGFKCQIWFIVLFRNEHMDSITNPCSLSLCRCRLAVSWPLLLKTYLPGICPWLPRSLQHLYGPVRLCSCSLTNPRRKEKPQEYRNPVNPRERENSLNGGMGAVPNCLIHKEKYLPGNTRSQSTLNRSEGVCYGNLKPK